MRILIFLLEWYRVAASHKHSNLNIQCQDESQSVKIDQNKYCSLIPGHKCHQNRFYAPTGKEMNAKSVPMEQFVTGQGKPILSLFLVDTGLWFSI